VGELTSSLPSEALAPIARTCEKYFTSIDARLSSVPFLSGGWEEGAQRMEQVKIRGKVTSN
jgi:hypothetical protein